MNETLLPTDEKEVAEIVAAAMNGRTPLAIGGSGTRSGLGRPMQTARTLSTAAMRGITLYEPSELVLAAQAGTPVSEIEELLTKNGQRLAFEPMDHRPLLGSSGEPTIGAVAAANVSGPRRIMAGAARDGLIGVRAVNGRGEIVKSGGRVMKNVTGYDLVKFLAGSYGTLAVLSEVTFKVLPTPETEATLVLASRDDRQAVALLSAALGTPFEITAAAHLPPHGGEPARTAIRIEGFAASVDVRAKRLSSMSGAFAGATTLDKAASQALWLSVRDLGALAAPTDAPVWRLSLKPGDAPVAVETIRRAFDCRVLYDWGGGLVWLAGGTGADAGAGIVRAAIAPLGGHATLVRAPADVRNTVDVFQPQPAPIMALTQKLKATFDPAGVLNPGRMYAGI